MSQAAKNFETEQRKLDGKWKKQGQKQKFETKKGLRLFG